MAIVTLKDELGYEVTSGGTWTYIGTTTPNPPPPVTWDGSVDFTGYATGLPYEYRYTVPSTCVGDPDLTADLTIILNQSIALDNDECDDNNPDTFLIVGGLTTKTFDDQNMAGECPGIAPASWSGEAVPSSWTTGSYNADMWYHVGIEIPDDTKFFEVIVNSGAYSVGEQLINPVIAGYTGSCAALVEDNTANPSTTTFTTMTSALTSGTYDFYIRVAAVDGNEGKFSITFKIT